jgi:hypothetical protein
MQVFLEKRVIGRQHRYALLARKSHPGIVRDERRMDVHQVERLRLQCGEDGAQRARLHSPVFRIARNVGCAHAHDVGIIGFFGRRLVGGHDQHGIHARRAQIAAEGTDRGGDAIDAREVDIGDEQYAQAK